MSPAPAAPTRQAHGDLGRRRGHVLQRVLRLPWWSAAGAALWFGCGSTVEVGSACAGASCGETSMVRFIGLQCAAGSRQVPVYSAAGRATNTITGLCVGTDALLLSAPPPPCRLIMQQGDETSTALACDVLGGRSARPGIQRFGCEVPHLDEAPPGAAAWYSERSGLLVQNACGMDTAQRTTITFTRGLPLTPPTAFFLRCDQAYAPSTAAPSGQTSAAPAPPVDPAICAPPDGNASDSALIGADCISRIEPSEANRGDAIYIENAAPECPTGLCMVYRATNQSTSCAPCSDGVCPDDCATATTFVWTAHCTCRCSTDSPRAVPLCACPTGFTCEQVVEGGPLAGGYCARDE